MSSNNNPTKYIMAWGIGISSIALFGLVMLILFGNLDATTLGFNNATRTITITNETEAWLNQTGYTLTGYNASWSSITITTLYNGTDGGEPGNYNISIPTANSSISAVGVLTSADFLYNSTNVSVSYTYTHSYAPINQINVNNYQLNYTESVLNTGKQFGTVGTILGVALLLVILIAILVYAIAKMTGVSEGKNKDIGAFDSGDFA